jgi:hypothetical protein
LVTRDEFIEQMERLPQRIKGHSGNGWENNAGNN